MLARYRPIGLWPCLSDVCLSACPLQAGVVSKRLSAFQHANNRTIKGLQLSFYNSRGAPNADEVGLLAFSTGREFSISGSDALGLPPKICLSAASRWSWRWRRCAGGAIWTVYCVVNTVRLSKCCFYHWRLTLRPVISLELIWT